MTCPHGMPTPASCFDCMEDGPVAEPARWLGVGLPFVAKFDGECSTCGGPMKAGRMQVQRWDFGDERTVYTHRDCRPL